MVSPASACSTADGSKACIEDVTGWAAGETSPANANPHERARCDALSLYQKMEQVILPTFYEQRDDWLRIMRHTIALNASPFNTQRMLQEYVLKGYFE
jgi:starch phosphorylase